MPLEDSKLPLKAKFRYDTPSEAGAHKPGYERDIAPPHAAGGAAPFEVGEKASAPPSQELSPVEFMAAGEGIRVPPEPVAVLVFHGMGEQVRYETLGDLAKSLLRAVNAPISTTVTMSRPAESFVARAEIGWRDDAGVDHEVHLYEAYWAPLTEGQITYVETLKFLFASAWTGIKSSRFGKVCKFQRWMFGGVVRLDIAANTRRNLVAVFLALLAVVGVILLLSLQVAHLLKTISSGHITLLELRNFALPVHPESHGLWLTVVVSLLFWGAVALSAFIRYFIIEYVGDVAAYISPYKASKFQALRDSIQKVGFDAASLVYGFTRAPIPDYKKVVFAAHSLGSVLAYDTLNAMINLDLVSGRHKDVVGRTHALITFGSPLDKTAFLFRNQANTLSDPLREQMAAANQPLIVDYMFRGPHFQWTNIYAPRDVISGSLEYYDDPADPQYAAKRIDNQPDPDAKIPFYAHVQYWNNPTLARVLLRAIS
jgi:hypothetical protein